MADVIDEANELAMMEVQSISIEARNRAAAIPTGEPGMCMDCGWDSKRLVHGRCAPCRDQKHMGDK